MSITRPLPVTVLFRHRALILFGREFPRLTVIGIPCKLTGVKKVWTAPGELATLTIDMLFILKRNDTIEA